MTDDKTGACSRIAVAYKAVADLATVLGVSSINRLAGCWECHLDEAWWIAVNGHNVTTQCSRGAPVPPYHVYVERCRQPAGLLAVNGGTIAPGGEDALIAALGRRARARGERRRQDD